MSSTAQAETTWWLPEDVAHVEWWLTGRMQSRLWHLTEPATVADWVFADPVPAPREPAPADIAPAWQKQMNATQLMSWALVGFVIRMAVPEALSTAGEHWHVARFDLGEGPLLRLVVGPLELLCLPEDGGEVRLRLAKLPLEIAAGAGMLDVENDWPEQGIELTDDPTVTFEEDKILLTCPDLSTALGLLLQRPVMAGLRMLGAGLSTKGYSFQRKYRRDYATKAWLAGEIWCAVWAAVQAGSPATHQGFDDPYTPDTVPSRAPEQRSYDGRAYLAGVREHDRLCQVLIGHLARSGLTAGAGLHGVPVDLAWLDGQDRQFIAEVKSTTVGNESEQLRFGLGQVLEYRHRLAMLDVPVTAVLLVSQYRDHAWWGTCDDSDVVLLAEDDLPNWLT
ncbi:hypothetical protein FHU28_004306 [Micromonospora echinospora]|uniref:Protein NO VEIN C-terminal domain-containing protein n=1 Tax=Micromonospora echinospora TaxID=1877 RepID=A0ABR6MGE1_MICEC|nr:hypothetical protein [Micromonospora echinospora]MBB5114467.1 hypothetical protein [Micromonospora echinospora]